MPKHSQLDAVRARLRVLRRSAMLELAGFRLGRVVLHLLAMPGDRAVRFHAAGIMRELF